MSSAIDNREIRARMDLPSTRILLDMGCDKDLVRQLIEERFREGRREFESATDLMAAYLSRGGTIRSQKSASTAPSPSSSGTGFPAGNSADFSYVDVRKAKLVTKSTAQS